MRARSQSSQSTYKLWRLVDRLKRPDFTRSDHSSAIICDIDKTYLETPFESWVKMARIAFEEAQDKVTVSGATAVLMAGRWGDSKASLDDAPRAVPRPLHFVSSSPPQLRRVLERKLALDGLDWSSDTFKNQAYNLRKGRFDLLKHQVAFKMAAILDVMAESPHESSAYYLIGDSAERDAYIYLGIDHFLSGRLSPDEFRSYVMISGVEENIADQLVARFPKPPHGRIAGIYIRLAPSYPFQGHAPLTDPVIPFNDFIDVGLHWFNHGLVSSKELETIVRERHNIGGMSLSELKARIERLLPLFDPEQQGTVRRLAESCEPRGADEESPTDLGPTQQPSYAALASLDSRAILAETRAWLKSLER